MKYKIKCETYARLCNVLNYMPENATEWFNSIRLEGNFAIASNKQIMVVERLDFTNPDEPMHIVHSEILRKQCENEAKFNSDLEINVNSMLKFSNAKTTFGYNFQENATMWNDFENDLGRWKEVVPTNCNTATHGAMFWEANNIANLSKSSPSGCIVFEEFIDERKPVIIRDINDENWFATFVPGVSDGSIEPAKLPEWWVNR